jgi:hypothetical protein
MALSTDTWLPILGGPGVGRLLMAVFGEGEGDQPYLPILTFTVGDEGSKHELKIVFAGIGFGSPVLDFSRKVYEITGRLEEIDGRRRKLPSVGPLVTIAHYRPDHVRKGDSALKIGEVLWYNDLETLFEQA